MKRALSFVLCLCLTLSLFATGFSASAAGNANDSAAMKAVLTQVKSRITIPEEFTQFEYSTYNSNGQTKWDFRWEDENSDKTIYITADSQGRISQYSLNQYDVYQNESPAPKVSRDDAAKSAEAFVKTAAPELSGKLTLNDTFSVSQYNHTYYFDYTRTENGLPCEGQGASISVSYVTGQVQEFSAQWDYDLTFEPAESVAVEQETARNYWMENTELELRYSLDYSGIDTAGRAINAFLRYSPKEEVRPINALTGELVPKDYEWVSRKEYGDTSAQENAAAADAGGGSSGSAGLTDEEIKKAAELDNLITSAQADQKVRGLTALTLAGDYRLTDSYLTARHYAHPVTYGEDEDIEYYWHLTYTAPVKEGDFNPNTVSATVDAKSGELLSYYDYSAYRIDENAKIQYTDAQAKAVADGLIDKAAPSKASSSVYAANEGEPENPWKTYSYERTHNNIPVDGNGMDVTVRLTDGKVTNFNTSWENNVNFESNAGILSQQEALKAYFENAQPVLGYRIFTTYLYDVANEDGEAAADTNAPAASTVESKYSTLLVYSFSGASNAISAKSGKFIDGNGKEIVESAPFTGYQDISGHYAEKEISLLADIGVLPRRENFGPNTQITQKEYLYYLFMTSNNFRYADESGLNDPELIDQIYEAAERYGVILEGERNPDAAVSRYQAVQYAIRYAGLGKLAEDASIYRVDFKDAASIPDQYLGSVALAKSMKIVGGSGGRFNGAQAITSGEAAKLVYNYMTCIGTYIK